MTIRYFNPYLDIDDDGAEYRTEHPAIIQFSYDDEALTLSRTTTIAAVSERSSVSINCEQLELLKGFADNDGELCENLYFDIEFKPLRDAMRSISLKVAAAMRENAPPPSRAAFGIRFK